MPEENCLIMVMIMFRTTLNQHILYLIYLLVHWNTFKISVILIICITEVTVTYLPNIFRN
jgi:hypothetical protein